jgi:hypothetical protein
MNKDDITEALEKIYSLLDNEEGETLAVEDYNEVMFLLKELIENI